MLLPNLAVKTFGGNIFWETIDSRSGWKLQQNVFTEHFRILDTENVRQAWSCDWIVINAAFRKFTRLTLIEG
jgi:hypothetical protein